MGLISLQLAVTSEIKLELGNVDGIVITAQEHATVEGCNVCMFISKVQSWRFV